MDKIEIRCLLGDRSILVYFKAVPRVGESINHNTRIYKVVEVVYDTAGGIYIKAE